MEIKKVLKKLGERRSVFTAEADFQLEFAWTIRELYPKYEIRMEYCPGYDKDKHIDILVKTDKGLIPIELKYKTKGCVLKSDDEEYFLKNHGAKDISCYLYLKDIQRIEEFKEKIPEFIEGYAIMLTNEPSYLNPPARAKCNYEEFSLHQGVEKHGKLNWGPNTGEGTKKGCEDPIVLKDTYTIKWDDYSTVGDDKGGTFHITVSTIS